MGGWGVGIEAQYGVERGANAALPLEWRSMATDEASSPKSIADFIDAIRAGLTCARCGRYVGSLAAKRYVPPPYPVALDKITADDEVAALVGFEWHMLGRLRDGNFTIMHPERDGACVTMREWLAAEDDDFEDDEAADEA